MAEPQAADEREIKLAFDLDAPLPDFTEMDEGVHVTDRDVIEFDAVYLDTDDLALYRRRIGIRRRLGAGWTYKGPSHMEGSLLVREEHEWPDSAELPAALRARVRDAIGDTPLGPVARLHTTRHRLDILDARGRRLAEIDDDIVTILDAGEAVDRYREVEVELANGVRAIAVDAVLDRFLGAGATPHATGKLTRALRALGAV